MTRAGCAVALAACLAIMPFGGVAHADAVVLKASPRLAKSIDAFPRIVAPPGNAAAQRINQGLAALDKSFRASAADCGGGNAERAVAVTLAGARFLSLVASDSWFCGAYPDTGTLALVYDLETGRPVNWAALLPASLGLKTTIDSHFDGTRIGMLRSPALSALYWSAIKDGPDAEDCRDVVTDDDVAFQAWPVASDDAVVLQPASLPHAVKACAIMAALPTAMLRRMGANPALLDDIDAAHARASRTGR